MFNQGTVFMADWVLNLNNQCTKLWTRSFERKPSALHAWNNRTWPAEIRAPASPTPKKYRWDTHALEARWSGVCLSTVLHPMSAPMALRTCSPKQHPVQTNNAHNTQHRQTTPSTDTQHPVQTTPSTDTQHSLHPVQTMPSANKQHPVQTHNTQYRQHPVHTQYPVQTHNTPYRHTKPSTARQHPVQTTPSTDTQHPVQTHQYRHTTPSSDTQHPVSLQTDTLLTQGLCLEHSRSWKLSFALNHLHLRQPSQLSRCFHAYLNKTECRFKLALKSEAILWLTWHNHLRKRVHRCWHKMLAYYATAHRGCMGTVRKSLH